MRSTTRRRLSAAVIAPALAAGVLVAAPSAQAATPNSYAFSAARWLSDQLTEGLVVTDGVKRYGQSLDVFFALDGLDVQEASASSIIDAFETQQDDYTTGEAFGDTGSRYVGATSKLATAVLAAGEDPSAFGGRDLVADVEGFVQTEGDQQGRASDVSNYGDNSNTLGQSYAVQVLAAAESDALGDATDYLLKQQCPNGAFRTFQFTVAVPDPDYPVDPVDLVCGEGPNTGDDELSVDTTALALQTLVIAKDAGVAGLDDDIADATAWLTSVQAADGSFQDRGTPNASSTGYAAVALKTVGRDGAAGSAAAWLVGRQVTDAVAEDTALAIELGAIAPDQGTLDDAKSDGIVAAERIRWVIATAQGALGVNAQLPATRLGATATTSYVKGGNKITVAVAGLGKGEKFSATIAGGSRAAGTADAAGRATFAVTTPKTSGSKVVTVTGSRANRTGSVRVKVLGARTLSTRLAYRTVKAGKSQKVVVKGLAAGERVTVYQSNRRKKTGTASSAGSYTATFKVGRAKGKKTVKVVGQFNNRKGSKSFRIR